MNVTQMNIIASDRCASINPGEVIAIRRSQDDGWLDPYGGVFDAEEQAAFDDVARGNQSHVLLRRGSRDRRHVVEVRLAVKF